MSDLPLFAWRPPEKIVPFPAVRRRSHIERTAQAAAAAKDPEKTIRVALDRLRGSHERKGISDEMVATDIHHYEMAIRTRVAALRAREGRSA